MMTVSDKGINDESLRVHLVAEMLLSGLQKVEIITNIQKNETLKWDITENEIDTLLEKAKEEIRDMMDLDEETFVANTFAKYEFLYKKLINVKDYKGALTAVEKSVALRKELKK